MNTHNSSMTAIKVTFHGKIKDLPVQPDSNCTCENVIWDCLQHIQKYVCGGDRGKKDLALYLPAFGLRQDAPIVSKENECWLPNWHKFSDNDSSSNVNDAETVEYKFRVRFMGLTGYRKNQSNLDCILREYLILQMRDDFFLDPSFPLVDMREDYRQLLFNIAICIPKELPLLNDKVVGTDFRPRKWKFTDFWFKSKVEGISKTLYDCFELNKPSQWYWLPKSLNNNMESFIKKKMTICQLKELFYKFLLTEVPDYGMERYQVVVPEHNGRTDVPLTVQLKLSQDNKSQNGLYFGQNLHCPIAEISELKLIKPENLQDQKWTVLIGLRDKVPKSLLFTSKEEAQSFFSMVQLKVRLCVRWDLYLNHDLLMPRELMDLGLNSFGPLWNDTAEDYIERLGKDPSFQGSGFLIHRSTSEYDAFIVVVGTVISTTSPQQNQQQQQQDGSDLSEVQLSFERLSVKVVWPEGYLLMKKCKGSTTEGQGQSDHDSFEEEEKFWPYKQLLRWLSEKYQLQALPVDYAKKADITEEYKKEIDTDGEDDQLIEAALFHDDEKTPSFFLPKDFTNERYITAKNIATRKYHVCHNGKEYMKVQLDRKEEHYAQAFREGLERLEILQRFEPQRFLRLYGMVLCKQLTIITELAPGSDLLTYICATPTTPVDKINLMLQVIACLHAMHESKHYHGNIRSRTFLVFPDQSLGHPRLKLEFPGITSYLDTLPLDDNMNLDRLAWLSPERRQRLDHVTYASECYAVGTTLVEIVLRTDEMAMVAGVKNNTQLKVFLENKDLSPPWLMRQGDQALLSQTEELWQKLWTETIALCWSRVENLRPDPHTLRNGFEILAKMASSIREVDEDEKAQKPVNYPALGMSKNASSYVTEEQLSRLLMEKDVPFIYFAEGQLVKQEETLGSGHFGKVWKGKLTNPKDIIRAGGSSIVAVKQIKLTSTGGQGAGTFCSEISIASGLEDPNILRVIMAGRLPCSVLEKEYSNIVLITEIMDGSLEKYIKENKDLDPAKTNKMLGLIVDVVKGMIYLSGKNIVHRDLAPRNILTKMLPDGRLTAKVSDFGLSRVTDDDYAFYRSKTMENFPFPTWPPECLGGIITDRMFSSQGDVWSFGVTFWQALTARDIIQELSRALGLNLSKHLEAHLRVRQLYLDQKWKLPGDHIIPNRVSAAPTDRERTEKRDRLYRVMLDCWKEEPKQRPKFVDLRVKIERLASIP